MDLAPRSSVRASTIIRAGLLAAALTLTLGAANAHATLAPVVVGQSQADAVFAEPLPGQRDDGIHRHLLSLINDTPPGEEIRAAIHSITNYAIADALVKRWQAGVDVKIVYPADKRSGDFAAATDRLGEIDTPWNPYDERRVWWCNRSGGSACISADSGGTMHAKFFLFSATGSGGLRKWVTWFGSANLTQQTGTETWNNGLTVYENPDLYNAFERELFDPMFGEDTALLNNDFYWPDGGRGHFSMPSAGLEVHASPEQDTDLVVSQLNEMRSDAASGCTVMVGMLMFNRTVVAEKLAAMKNAGCAVFVLVGRYSSGAEPVQPGQRCDDAQADPDALRILREAGIPIRAKKIHDKIMLLNTMNKGSTVLTGSHNLTKSALRDNDEILVEIQSPSVYDAYSHHWWSAWMNSCPVGTNL